MQGFFLRRPPSCGMCRGDLFPRNGKRSCRACMRRDFKTARRLQFTPPCSMRAVIIARFAPCTGFWKEGEVRERRDQLVHPAYSKPELLATGPNQLWSWDITKLLGPAKWTYFYLYVILDVFSRYVVGWMVADGESSELARRLIADTCGKQRIEPGKLTIHADRGSSMTSKPVAFLMADLGITKTHSRPHVSDDNPYSESHFRTLKYRPGFPERFGSLQDARSFSQAFFAWYNDEHRHSGLGLLSPAVVHYGLAPQAIERRRAVLDAAYSAHPERFVRKLNASSASRLNRCPHRRRSGSISHNNHQKTKLSKLCCEVSQTR